MIEFVEELVAQQRLVRFAVAVSYFELVLVVALNGMNSLDCLPVAVAGAAVAIVESVVVAAVTVDDGVADDAEFADVAVGVKM